MSHRYNLLVHERRGRTRHLEVEVLSDDPEAEPIVETYDWGMDVPIQSVRSETLALLDAKYYPDVEDLPGAGSEF